MVNGSGSVYPFKAHPLHLGVSVRKPFGSPGPIWQRSTYLPFRSLSEIGPAGYEAIGLTIPLFLTGGTLGRGPQSTSHVHQKCWVALVAAVSVQVGLQRLSRDSDEGPRNPHAWFLLVQGRTA